MSPKTCIKTHEDYRYPDKNLLPANNKQIHISNTTPLIWTGSFLHNTPPILLETRSCGDRRIRLGGSLPFINTSTRVMPALRGVKKFDMKLIFFLSLFSRNLMANNLIYVYTKIKIYPYNLTALRYSTTNKSYSYKLTV